MENQLPNLRKESACNDKIEHESNQKEKLTLKIVKTSDGTQTIEQKNSKSNQERDKHILYRVLSRNEDGYESSDQSRVKTIILKRNIRSDLEKEISKKVNVQENTEISDNNLLSNLLEQNELAQRRKSIRDELKQTKVNRNVNSRSTTPDTQLKRKAIIIDINEENELLEELPEIPTKKRKMPLIVSANRQNIPSGTHEIHSLSERSITFSKRKSNNRSSFHRSKSVDKESIKTDNVVRRLSVSSTNHSSIHEPSISNINSRLKLDRSLSKTLSSSSTPLRRSFNQPTNEASGNLNLNIKNEPLSDEEIVEREQVTVNDIRFLVSEGNNKRKTILISTSDNSNDSFPSNSRARKSFPNSLVMSQRSVDLLQAQPIRNTNAMVCIPQVFPINEQSPIINELELTDETGDIQKQAIASSQITSNAIDLPSLIPKPSGVFTSEGNTFHQESGAVSTLFSENAHRMTDYFKSLLIDTIGAISSGVSDAQNVLLKLELEKTKQQLHDLRNENQLKIDKLKKEHADEIKVLKISYGKLNYLL